MRFGEEEEDFERCVLGPDFTEQNGVLPTLDAEAKLILERCTAVRKRDLFEVVAQNDYDACLAVEQLVFADIVRSTSARQRAATLE